ncbi:30S ribosomal protein S8e [Candidatus Bathyarchaeota archaeon]|nr:30S ribosomal protein S8e [Candidatus Bathyarchaeota archaeon]MBS7627843.1 30S ribosomal protein S8e [Candidatus Bathyarchaeota archaeon]
MPYWHDDLKKRKRSGGRRWPFRNRKKAEQGGYPAETILGNPKVRLQRARGGNLKQKLLSSNVANVLDPASKKVQRLEILRVVQNPANRDYSRRGIITRGAIIETPAGRARVTSRPGQDGVVNAVLIG